MSKKVSRALSQITSELQTALKRETDDIIAIGALLNEANAQLDHGEWLSWLSENFGSSVSTAYNYMKTAKFVAKFPTVGNFKLRPSALYELANDLDDPSGLYDCKAIRAIFKAAKNKWISGSQARDIAEELQKPPEPPPLSEEELAAEMAARQALDAAREAELNAILNGPPPELPPAPETSVHDVILPSFNQAVWTLKNLQTKPLEKFAGSYHSAADIRVIGDFLHQVADVIEKTETAMRTGNAASAA
jgi:hypothetical protein